jgi:hypothetical protein
MVSQPDSLLPDFFLCSEHRLSYAVHPGHRRRNDCISVGIIRKYLLLIIPSLDLGDVVRIPRRNDSCYSWHVSIIWLERSDFNINSCPYYFSLKDGFQRLPRQKHKEGSIDPKKARESLLKNYSSLSNCNFPVNTPYRKLNRNSLCSSCPYLYIIFLLQKTKKLFIPLLNNLDCNLVSMCIFSIFDI